MGRTRYTITLALSMGACFTMPITMINLGPDSLLTRGAAVALLASLGFMAHLIARKGWEDAP